MPSSAPVGNFTWDWAKLSLKLHFSSHPHTPTEKLVVWLQEASEHNLNSKFIPNIQELTQGRQPYMYMSSQDYNLTGEIKESLLCLGRPTFRKTQSNLDFSKSSLLPPTPQIQISKYPLTPWFFLIECFFTFHFSIKTRPLTGLGRCDQTFKRSGA